MSELSAVDVFAFKFGKTQARLEWAMGIIEKLVEAHDEGNAMKLNLEWRSARNIIKDAKKWEGEDK